MILVWIAVYIWQLYLDQGDLDRLYQALGLPPAAVLEGYRAMVEGSNWLQQLQGARDCAQPLFTYQFLHSGPLHLLGNALFLWVFGGRLEARAGAVRMSVFSLLCGAVAGFVQVLGDPTSLTPTIGASGAVFGTLAAYMVFYRRARILLLVPVVVVPVFVEIPIVLLVLVFFVLQLPWVQGLFSMGSTAPVAYLAHLGGLGAGILLTPLLRKRPRRRARSSKRTQAQARRLQAHKRSCPSSNASGSPTS